MKYKTVLVAENSAICGGTVLTEAIQRSLDEHSAQGYVLVQAYQQVTKTCIRQQEVGAVLIFAKRR
jgi:hypothetical protein